MFINLLLEVLCFIKTSTSKKKQTNKTTTNNIDKVPIKISLHVLPVHLDVEQIENYIHHNAHNHLDILNIVSFHKLLMPNSV